MQHVSLEEWDSRFPEGFSPDISGYQERWLFQLEDGCQLLRLDDQLYLLQYLLLLVIGTISLLFLSGMASRSANIAAKDSTRQAIGAGFLLEGNPENRNKRLQEAFKAIEEKFGVGQSGSYQGVHAETIISNGQPSGYVWTDHSFESLVREDIEKIAAASGISDYNITTVPTPVKL